MGVKWIFRTVIRKSADLQAAYQETVQVNTIAVGGGLEDCDNSKDMHCY